MSTANPVANLTSSSSPFDPSNPPPAQSESEMMSPSFITRSLQNLTKLSPSMSLSSTSRDDATKIITLQVLFLTGATLTSIRNSPILKSYPSPMHGLVGVIGCGLIGSAVVDALLESGFPPSSIMVASRDSQKVDKYAKQGCIRCDDSELVQTCKVVIICVAPQHLRGLGNQIRKVGRRNSVIISTVAGVSGVKIGKLLGISRVIRTFVDLVQLPVEWGASGPPTSLVTSDALTVSAKNFVAEKNVLQYSKACIESLCEDMGLGKRDSSYEATYAIVGDGEIGGGGSPVKKKREEGEGKEEEEDHPLHELHGFLKYWKEVIAVGFFEIFAEEVYAKDLPAFNENNV